LHAILRFWDKQKRSQTEAYKSVLPKEVKDLPLLFAKRVRFPALPGRTKRKLEWQFYRIAGRGVTITVRPSFTLRRAASRICTTTIFVSSPDRSPTGFTLPRITATR